MSKIANIRSAAKEGKGSVKMIEYLLWYSDSINFELKLRDHALGLPHSAPYYEVISIAGMVKHQRDLVDRNEISIAEYFLAVKSHHRYESFKDL